MQTYQAEVYPREPTHVTYTQSVESRSDKRAHAIGSSFAQVAVDLTAHELAPHGNGCQCSSEGAGRWVPDMVSRLAVENNQLREQTNVLLTEQPRCAPGLAGLDLIGRQLLLQSQVRRRSIVLVYIGGPGTSATFHPTKPGDCLCGVDGGEIRGQLKFCFPQLASRQFKKPCDNNRQLLV